MIPVEESFAAWVEGPAIRQSLQCALAINGHADLIVTGDGDLLALNPFREISIGDACSFQSSAPVLFRAECLDFY